MTGLSLRVFLNELDKLNKHLDILDKTVVINELIQNSIIDEITKNQINSVLYKDVDEKIFDYNSNIISLYGYWEKFIESVIKEYLHALKNLNTSQDEKNKRISSKYSESILPLFGKLVRKRYKFSHLTEIDLIDSLHKGCVMQMNDYIPEAFYQSGGNYNYSETLDCLTRLGFFNFGSVLCKYNVLRDYFISEGKTEESINTTEPSLLYSKLNNLVFFRNEIAHGSFNGNNIIDANEIRDYIKFMRAFSHAIFDFMNDDILLEKWKRHKGAEIEVRQYFCKHNVVELRKGIFYIDQANYVLCFRGNAVYPRYVRTKIKSMNVNDTPYHDQYYLSYDATEKVTLVMDYKMRRGDLLKFEE